MAVSVVCELAVSGSSTAVIDGDHELVTTYVDSRDPFLPHDILLHYTTGGSPTLYPRLPTLWTQALRLGHSTAWTKRAGAHLNPKL